MAIALRYFLLLLLFVYPLAAGSGVGFATIGTNAGTVSVSIDSVSCDPRGKPRFDWIITNHEKQPVYIYSTFLRGPAASRSFDERSHVYTIWTSLPEKADYSVNDYSPAKFILLKSGEVLRGRFLEYPRHPDGCAKCGKLPKGAANISFAVAFGGSTESVEKALREGHYIHPANPIVEWQQIAKSAPVQLHGCIAAGSKTGNRGQEL